MLCCVPDAAHPGLTRLLLVRVRRVVGHPAEGVKKEFPCTSTAGNWRLEFLEDFPAVNSDCGACSIDSGGEPFVFERRAREMEFEHRFDEYDQLGVACNRQRTELRDGVRDRQIGEVDRDDVDGFAEPIGSELGKVRALKIGDPRILAKRSKELTMSRIERVDMARPSLQKRNSEAAGRGADVERNATRDRAVECCQRGAQFHGPSEWARSLHGDGCVLGHTRRGS